MEQMLYFEKQIIFAVAFVSCHLISRLEEKRIPPGTNQNAPNCLLRYRQ